MENSACPKCHLLVLPVFYFCPNCGKVLRAKPLSTSVGKQIGIYLLSIFLPPLGLIPGFKYLFQKESGAKIVGGVAIGLTIISIAITVNLAMGLFNQYALLLNPQLNSGMDSQLNPELIRQLQDSLQMQK